PQHSEVSPPETVPALHEIQADAASHASETAAPAAPSAPLNLEESVEEIRFYIGQGMTEQAEQILERLELLAPGAPEIALLRRGIESAKQPSATSEAPVSIDESEIQPPPAVAVVEEVAEPAAPVHATSHPQPWPAEPPAFHQPAAEVEA